MFSVQEKEDMMKTARSRGAIGSLAVLPRFLSEIPALKTHMVLDFGCGKDAIHVKKLRKLGFEFVYGLDLEPLEDSRLEFCMCNSFPWQVVYASNVLNIQPSLQALCITISQIADYARYGIAYMSYPSSPRRLDICKDDLQDLISKFFLAVYRFSYRHVTIFKAVGKHTPEAIIIKDLDSPIPM